MKEFIVIGQISKHHGIKGEVKVIPMTDNPNRFKKLQYVLIDGEEKKVEGCKLQSSRVILKIEGIDSIEEATKYKNKYLSVSREDAAELPEGHYYFADLIGCTVVDEEGEEHGKVYDIIETGSNDVYWVKKGQSELLVPALESVVSHIDIEKSIITIKPLKEWM